MRLSEIHVAQTPVYQEVTTDTETDDGVMGK
jgi:hypothetical protein